MNYKRIYDNIIERAKLRSLSKDIYVENHHIIPRCMNGSDRKNNIAKLLGREHCLAHLLLLKIYPNELKIFHSAWMMYNIYHKKNKKYNCRTYEWLRKKQSENLKQLWSNLIYKEKLSKKMRGKIRTPEMRMRISQAGKGRIAWNKGKTGVQISTRKGKSGFISKETRKKLSESHKGHIHSEEQKHKISKKLTGIIRSDETRIKMSGKIRSEEHCKNLSSALKGKHHSKETKLKISKSNKGKKRSEEYCKNLSIVLRGIIVSEETCKKISESNKGKIAWNKGKMGVSEETKLKMSEAQQGQKSHMFGKHIPEDIKIKMSNSKKGKKCLEETKRKISNTLKGKKQSPEVIKKRAESIKLNHLLKLQQLQVA